MAQAPNASDSNSETIPPLVAGILDEFLQTIRPAMGLLLVVTILASMLIPLLITLFYLSDPPMRKKPIFILNVFSIVLGIAIAIWSDYIELVSILSPTTDIPVMLYVAFAIIVLFAPWLSEFVLTLRLLAVFPPSRNPRKTLALVFAFPVIIKLVRFVVLIMFIRHFVEEMKGYAVVYEAVMAVDYRHIIYVQLEWYLQIFDNTYLSSLFIWRLIKSQHFTNRGKRRSVLRGIYDSLASRVKSLLWIALSNFVIPVLFNIVLIIDLYTDPNYHTNISYLVLVNYYVTVISVVFATVWSSTYSYRRKQSLESHGVNSSQRFQPPTDGSQTPLGVDIKRGNEASWGGIISQGDEIEVPLHIIRHPA